MIFLYDLDNTIYDLLGGLEDKFPTYSRINQKTYSFSTTEGVVAEEVYSLFESPNFFYQLKPYSQVLETIHILRKQHEVKFFSKCFNAKVGTAKRLRLMEDLGYIPDLVTYSDINPLELKFDILIDDYREKVETLMKEKEGLKVIIHEHEYNKGLEGDGVHYLNPTSKTYKRDFFKLLESNKWVD